MVGSSARRNKAMKRTILATVAAMIFAAPGVEAAEHRHAGPELSDGQRFDPSAKPFKAHIGV
jgi:hypothetical protein